MRPASMDESLGHIFKEKQFLDVAAFAYQRIITETDFVCRNRAVWCKPNVPSPIRSRLKQSTESVDWFVKNADEYYFNPRPWLKKTCEATKERSNYIVKARPQTSVQRDIPVEEMKGRLLETVEHSWRIIPVGEKQKGFELNGKEKQEHVAPFPEALVKPWVESLTPKQVCSKCGKPLKVKIVSERKEPIKHIKFTPTGEKSLDNVRSISGATYNYPTLKVKFEPSCECGVEFVAGVVLDPFLGSGTVLKIARDLSLNGVGIELNAKYLDYAKSRVNWKESLSGYDYEVVVVGVKEAKT